MDLKAVDQGEAKRIIALQEGHFLDHKNMRISPAKLSESISALANASGGELFVGIAETTDKKSKCWEGYPDLGSATATLRLRFGLPRDEFLRDAVRKNSSSTATSCRNDT